MKSKKPMESKQEVNVTDQTTTFPCPLHDLKSWLEVALPFNIVLPDRKQPVVITKDNLKDILKEARVSMFNPERTYIYNNKLFQKTRVNPKELMNYMDFEVEDPAYAYDYQPKPSASCSTCIFPKIRDWAKERGIYDKGDSKTQYVKLMEEAGEVARAILKKDKAEVKDGIGDMVVVLTNLAHLEGFTIEECIEAAYDVISKRKGTMTNGTFVKNETL